jgi:hypothetical protein
VDEQYQLESVAEPRNVTPSPLDNRVPWALYLMMSRRTEQGDVIRMFAAADMGDRITWKFASQLETLGFYREALLVAMFLTSSER